MTQHRTLELTIKKIERQFPDQIMLGVPEVAQVYGITQKSVYNALRKNATSPFPKPIKRCGKLYWNLVQIAEDLTAATAPEKS